MEICLFWMCGVPSNFPIKNITALKLEAEEKAAYEKEISLEIKQTSHVAKTNQISEKIKKRLEFSGYILHPNKYRFKSSVRILGLVFHFIFKISAKLQRTLFAEHKSDNENHGFKHFFVGQHQSSSQVGMSGLLYYKMRGTSYAAKVDKIDDKMPYVILSNLRPPKKLNTSAVIARNSNSLL